MNNNTNALGQASCSGSSSFINSDDSARINDLNHIYGIYSSWLLIGISIYICIYLLFKWKPPLLYFIPPILLVANIIQIIIFHSWWYSNYYIIHNMPMSVLFYLTLYGESYLSYMIAALIINMIAWMIFMLVIIRAILKVESSRLLTDHAKSLATE